MDDDECALGADNCEQVCVNTDGGFRCECNSGFVLNSDQTTCSGENLQRKRICFIQPFVSQIRV